MLVTVVNPRPSNMNAEMPLQDGWLACEPLSGQLYSPAGGALKVSLGAGVYRHFLLQQIPRVPHLLYALGARLPAHQTYDSGARKMRIEVDAAEGARIRVGIFTPIPVRAVTGTRVGRIPFSWKDGISLLSFEVIHTPGELFEISFE